MMRHCAFVRAIRVKSAARRQAAVAKRPLLTRITRPKSVLQSGKSRFCKPCVIPDIAMIDSSATPFRHACGSPHSTPRLTSIIATLPARLAGQAWPLGHRRLAARSVLEAPAEPAGPFGIEAKTAKVEARKGQLALDPIWSPLDIKATVMERHRLRYRLTPARTDALCGGPQRVPLLDRPDPPTPYSARTTRKDPPCPAPCTATASSTSPP
jgi:hypothetical protein